VTSVGSIIVKRTAKTDVGKLTTYAKNPRVGNIDLIAESLEKTGQYRPILVNERDMQVLAGNHTYLAARKLGWTHVYASFVDVDDDVAKRIVLADNKTADAGTYDESILAELLASLPDVSGTGFNQEEMDALLSSIGTDIEQQVAGVDDLSADTDNEDAEGDGSESDTFEPEVEGVDIDDVDEEIKGGFTLKLPEEMTFDHIGAYDMPRLKPESLMKFEELPTNLKAWAGSATKDWPDDEQWWLYNWGIDSTSGMKDVSKVIVSFYTWDDYFEGWYESPERFVAKLLNSGIKYIITPDYSQLSEDPKAVSVWNLYRARFVGRYFQECGLKVVPNISWRAGDMNYLEEHILATLPVGLPLIAMQLQTVDYDKAPGGKEMVKKGLKRVFEVLQPQGVLFYVGKQAQELIDDCVPKGVNVMVVESRMFALAEQAKQREKKTGI